MSTTLVHLDFLDVARAADGVIAGTVADITARRSEEGIIYSFVTLEDLEVIQGSYGGETYTLRLEGGRLNDEVQHVQGAPNFREGERVVVFIDDNGEAIVPIAGWEQGLFRVIRDRETGAALMTDASGNRIFGIADGELVKESRFGTEAELFGGPEGGFAASDPGQVDFGQAQGGEMLAEPPEGGAGGPELALQGIVGEPMTYEAFTNELSAQVQAAGVADFETLISVEVGTLPERSFQDAAPGTVPDPADPIRTLPPERGEIPRRIDPGQQPNLDADR